MVHAVQGSATVARATTLLALSLAPACVFAHDAPVTTRRIARADLCVTNGAVTELPDGRLAVETASLRAMVRAAADAADQVAEIRFRYLGPTASAKPLASGEVRRQIGLKLRAEDGCNLVYVMWRIDPAPGITVSVKRNPGMHTHAECGARGYVTIQAREHADPPPVVPGGAYVLRAELQGDALTVSANGAAAWRGALARALPLPEGPPGLRSDNARFIFDFYDGPPVPAQSRPLTDKRHCAASEDD